MAIEELLSQLKDIRDPLEPGWWPLATAWWCLIGLLILLLISLWLIIKRRQVNRAFVIANSELKNIEQTYHRNSDSSQLAIELSSWLKRVALYAFPDQHLEALTGQGWLEFLDQSAGNNQFTQGVGNVFGSTVYQRNVSLNAQKLFDLCGQWLQSIKPQLAGQDPR